MQWKILDDKFSLQEAWTKFAEKLKNVVFRPQGKWRLKGQAAY